MVDLASGHWSVGSVECCLVRGILVIETVPVFSEPFGHDDSSDQDLDTDSSILRHSFESFVDGCFE